MIKEVVETVKQSLVGLYDELEAKDKEIAKIQAEKDALVEDIFALEHFVKRHEVKEEIIQEENVEATVEEVAKVETQAHEITTVIVG